MYGGCLAPLLGHPAFASPYSEIFISRKMEFKRWVTDCTRTTVDEVAHSFFNLKQMIPLNAQRFVDWEQTNTEQWNWPTKVLISMWFKSETNLATMIELLMVVKDELKKKPHGLGGQAVTEIGNEPQDETRGESPRVVLQRPQKRGRERFQNQRLYMVKFR